MNKCTNCNKETSNPKFCSKSCSNGFHNKENPKRRPEHSCTICGKPVNAQHRICSDECRKRRKVLSTERTAAASYSHTKRFRKNQKNRAVEYLGGKCTLCGYNKCNQSLDFHHKNPTTKEFSISQNCNRSWSKMVKELDKCIILCRNCHGEVHAGITSL